MASHEPSTRWGAAIVVACPTCAGGAVLAVGAVLFGVTVAVVKGALLAGAAGMAAGLWIRNAWRRRRESCRVDA